jgi:hypothetical protein
MERDDVLNMRIPADLKAALRRAAEDERRSMSAQVDFILSAWLAERGYLKRPRHGAGPGRVRRG